MGFLFQMLPDSESGLQCGVFLHLVKSAVRSGWEGGAEMKGSSTLSGAPRDLGEGCRRHIGEGCRHSELALTRSVQRRPSQPAPPQSRRLRHSRVTALLGRALLCHFPHLRDQMQALCVLEALGVTALKLKAASPSQLPPRHPKAGEQGSLSHTTPSLSSESLGSPCPRHTSPLEQNA